MIANFLIIWQQRDAVLAGLLNTVILLAVSGVASLVLGTLLTPMLMSQNKAVSRVAAVYVDAMRCAPFLLFVYLIYFGLPTLGIRMSNWSAGALALILYNAAYMGELLRGAWVELPASLIESGKAFGFRGFELIACAHERDVRNDNAHAEHQKQRSRAHSGPAFISRARIGLAHQALIVDLLRIEEYFVVRQFAQRVRITLQKLAADRRH